MAASTTKALTLSAATAMLTGLAACAGGQAAPTDANQMSDVAAAAKHCCKGQNDCKGQGGCHSDTNDCNGKNACRGKGGCATDDNCK